MNRLKRLTRFALPVICSGVFAVLLAGCTTPAYSVPDFQSPPQVLELETLLAEYRADPEAAEEKYRGERFLFPSIEVDDLMSDRIGDHRVQLSDMYLQSGSARFLPRDRFALDHVGFDFIVDIVGEVRGWRFGYFTIENCTYIIVEGGDLPDPGGY